MNHFDRTIKEIERRIFDTKRIVDDSCRSTVRLELMSLLAYTRTLKDGKDKSVVYPHQ